MHAEMHGLQIQMSGKHPPPLLLAITVEHQHSRQSTTTTARLPVSKALLARSAFHRRERLARNLWCSLSLRQAQVARGEGVSCQPARPSITISCYDEPTTGNPPNRSLRPATSNECRTHRRSSGAPLGVSGAQGLGMDPFVGYAAISSQQHFWQELDDILDPSLTAGQAHGDAERWGDQDGSGRRRNGGKGSSSARIATVSALQRFLALTDACYDRYLEHDLNRAYAVKRLVDSALFDSEHEQYASECIVDNLRTATSLRKVLICYDVILLYGERNPAIYRLLQSRIKDLIFRLVHQIWAGLYATQAEERIANEEAAAARDSRGAKSGQSLHFEYARRAASQSAAQGGHTWGEQLPGRKGAGGALTESNRGGSAILSGGRVGEPSSASTLRHQQIELRSKAVRMMYEVCRVQELESVEMRPLDLKFLNHLFDLVEQTREYHDDSFNYQLIKLIVAINEQFMVAGFAGGDPTQAQNLVLDVFRTRLNVSKTFGENLIFMLNRASSDAEDICMQLLVLKLLYILFTTEDTAHYFYTNDLKVLVDVFIRELSDLPDESESLRHTYLRVLHPLLTNTQLCTTPYKRPQIRRLLLSLISLDHIRDVSATTKRLVERCLRAEWCVALDQLTQGTSQAGPGQHAGGDTLGIAVAKLERIGGTGESVLAIQTSTALDGAVVIAPENRPALGPVSARSGTTLAVAAANVDERTLSVTSAIDIPGGLPNSPMSSVQPSPSAADANRSFDSDLSQSLHRQLVVSTSASSLPIMAPRARDKRVSSVSHPKSPVIERTRGTSNLATHSSSHDVRTAPPTPPRRESFGRSGSVTSTTAPADTDSISSHSTNTSSSWQNNLVEASAPVQSHVQPSSPLGPATRKIPLKESAHSRARTTDGTAHERGHRPPPFSASTLPPPSLHVQESSDSTIRNGKSAHEDEEAEDVRPDPGGALSLDLPATASPVRRIRSHSQLSPSAQSAAVARGVNTPSPSGHNGRRRPPPPPTTAYSTGSLTPTLPAAVDPSAALSPPPPPHASGRSIMHAQTLAPMPIRAPPPINRATKGTRSPANFGMPASGNSPNPPQGSFDARGVPGRNRTVSSAASAASRVVLEEYY
ncbi:hypothetical protein V8E36_006425 [Tilletia maclaganii]